MLTCVATQCNKYSGLEVIIFTTFIIFELEYKIAHFSLDLARCIALHSQINHHDYVHNFIYNFILPIIKKLTCITRIILRVTTENT